MGKPTAGANLWSELADRQARRLAEGQTMGLALHIEGVQTPPSGPSLGVPLAGKGAIIRTWMFQKLLKLLGHIKRFISTSGHFYTVSENT